MNLDADQFLQNLLKESDNRTAMLEKLWSAADSTRVFGQPVPSGDYTVIPAAEIAGGGGFGSGMGFGNSCRKGPTPELGEEPAAAESSPKESPGAGAGGGGGGGGGSMGRPVAAIVIGPEGVEIKPIVDVSKIGLTALAAFSAIALVGLKILKKRL